MLNKTQKSLFSWVYFDYHPSIHTLQHARRRCYGEKWSRGELREHSGLNGAPTKDISLMFKSLEPMNVTCLGVFLNVIKDLM